MSAVRVGICGLGTVGGAAFNLLNNHRALIDTRAGQSIHVTAVGARRDKPGCDTSGVAVERDVFAVASRDDVDILVELIGGTTTAKDLVLSAIDNGKHVVTANKALIAEHGNEVFKAAARRGVSVVYEAAVAGGIPIIKALREGLAANRIDWIAGIINGTGNYILTEMRAAGRAFDDVLIEAQKLGYAEADPAFDVEGTDAAHKLVILAAIAFGMPLRFDATYTEGITSIDTLDVMYAEELGYRIKHLGIARRRQNGVELRVHPTLIPENQLISQVNGVMNAVMIKGDAVGPTLFYGAGAGAGPTASAVVADIVDLARSVAMGADKPAAPLGVGQDSVVDTEVLAVDDIEAAYYLRAQVFDKPGVLSSLAQIISEHGISIEAIIQKPPLVGAEQVSLIMLTNVSREQNVREAVAEMEALDVVKGPIVRMRVESLDA